MVALRYSEMVTIVIPSFNRPNQLRKCLETAQKNLPLDLKIIVVDDGSAVPLVDSVGLIGNVDYLRIANSGPAKARNHGVGHVSTPYVAFIDDDCGLTEGWVENLVDSLLVKPDALVGGQTKNELTTNPYSTCSQAICQFLYEFYDAEKGKAQFFTSNNMACKKTNFMSIGGFDETFPYAAAEDRDLGLRWTRSGWEMLYKADAVVNHFHNLSFRSFLKQHYNYGKGAFHLHQILKAQNSWFPPQPKNHFHLRLLKFILLSTDGNRFLQVVLTVLSQVSMVAGYGVQKFLSNKKATELNNKFDH